MGLIEFFLGLGLGAGVVFWRQQRLKKQMRSLLRSLQQEAGVEEVSLSIVSQLRRGITLANQRQQELEIELDAWEQLLAKAPMGYLQVDEENQLVWCNEQARQLLQIDRWQPGQVRLLLELVRSYELDRLIEQCRTSGQGSVREWVFYPDVSQGTRSPPESLFLRASSLPLSQGQVGVYIENRQPYIELTQRRDVFISDLAHELRTPLTSIHLVAEALQSYFSSGDVAQNPRQAMLRRWVDQMLGESDRLIGLVQDWLELSQLEIDPSQQLNYQTVELGGLINSVWRTLEPLAQLKQLSLNYSASGEIEIQGDRSRLTQVFINLFDNALKHSPTQSAIRVVVSHVAKEIQIDVIDSGSGFAEADLPHVFERLYRGDASRTREENSPSVSNGCGLGLAIAKTIILAHGGSIQALNHPTGGAWIQIKLNRE